MLKDIKAKILRLLHGLRGENVLDYICGSEALPLPYTACPLLIRLPTRSVLSGEVRR